MISQPWIQQANVISELWFSGVLWLLIETTILFVLLVTLWWAIRRRVQPQIGYWLFLLVPLKLLLPITFSVPASIAQWSPTSIVARHAGMHAAPTSDMTVTQRPPVSFVDDSLRAEHLERNESSSSNDLSSHPVLVAGTSAAPVITHEAKTKSKFSVKSYLMFGWAAVVTALFAVFVRQQRRLSRRLRSATEFADRIGSIAIKDLIVASGTRQSVRFIESDCVAAPAVSGVLRPKVIIPPGFANSISTESLRWALLHELGHVRRRDLIAVWFQRIVGMLWFFHPIAWIASRIIDQQREYVCDDLAESWAIHQERATRNSLSASEAFVQTLRFAHQQMDVGQIDSSAALSVLGFGSRQTCRQRVVRLLNEKRPRGSHLHWWAIMTVMLLGLVLIPQLRAAPEPEPQKPDPPAQKPDTKNVVDAPADFTVSFVGPKGEPIPNAEIRWDMIPGIDPEAIVQGTYIRGGKNRFYVQSDNDGKVAMNFPGKIDRLMFGIKAPGYGPYWGYWDPVDAGDLIPKTFTAELEPAWKVGGIVVDENGDPIPGVVVRPSIKYRKRAGDKRNLGVNTRIGTNESGGWDFDMVPDSKESVWVELTHSEYKPHRLGLARDEFELQPGEAPTKKIVLPRGLTIRGTVTDADGKPIQGALLRTKFLNDERSAITNENGKYEIHGCDDRNARVVVTAKGKAVDMAQVRVHDKMDSVDFKMQPGGHVKIRVVDAQGKGLPKARIFFQRWGEGRFEYFEFDHRNQYTDQNGVWEWNEAPLDEFQADICHPNGMQMSYQKINARPEEYVFQPPGFLIVTGLVTDSETKQLLPKFRVVPGIKESEKSKIKWETDKELQARDGKYRLKHIDEESFAHFVRIDAEGYLPQVSRAIQSNEGTIKLFFKMKRGQDVAAVVQDRTGKPITGANVVLGVSGTQMMFRNGRVQDRSTFNAVQRTTDETGRFAFPPQISPFEIVIVADAGYAHLKQAPGDTLKTVELTPWAKIDGKYFIGSKPAKNVGISIRNSTISSWGGKTPNISMSFNAQTNDEGVFHVDRVPEGTTWVTREIIRMVDEGATEVTSTPIVPVQLTSGKTTQVQIGGSGSPVTGQLATPESVAKTMDWKHAQVDIQIWIPEVPEPPIPQGIANPEAQQKWFREWKQTEPGKKWFAETMARERKRDSSLEYFATIDQNGKFRIDDIVPGKYEMTVRNYKGPGVSNYRFEVVDKAVDLGNVQVE